MKKKILTGMDRMKRIGKNITLISCLSLLYFSSIHGEIDWRQKCFLHVSVDTFD
jgi:hypothetical protein